MCIRDRDEAAPKDAVRIRFDMLNAISEVFSEKQNIEYLCESGMATIHRTLNYVIPQVVADLQNNKSWDDIQSAYTNVLKSRLAL